MIEIVSFGCRLNAFESEVMRGHAAATGLERAVVAGPRTLAWARAEGGARIPWTCPTDRAI